MRQNQSPQTIFRYSATPSIHPPIAIGQLSSPVAMVVLVLQRGCLVTSHCSAFEWPLRYLDYLISRTFWELYGQQPRKNMWDDLQISM